MNDYPLTMPATPAPRDIEWTPESSVAMSRSIFSYRSQTYDWRGRAWRVTITFPPMSVADAKTWQAFLHELNGRAGTFFLSDSIGDIARGTVAGTPLVDGGGQTSDTLITDGWTASDNVKQGDWISIYDRLYMITEDATESGGSMTLKLWPEADEPGDNATILYGAAALGVFRLIEFPPFGWPVHRLQHELTLVAISAKQWGAMLEENGDPMLEESATTNYLKEEGA